MHARRCELLRRFLATVSVARLRATRNVTTLRAANRSRLQPRLWFLLPHHCFLRRWLLHLLPCFFRRGNLLRTRRRIFFFVAFAARAAAARSAASPTLAFMIAPRMAPALLGVPGGSCSVSPATFLSRICKVGGIKSVDVVGFATVLESASAR